MEISDDNRENVERKRAQDEQTQGHPTPSTPGNRPPSRGTPPRVWPKKSDDDRAGKIIDRHYAGITGKDYTPARATTDLAYQNYLIYKMRVHDLHACERVMLGGDDHTHLHSRRVAELAAGIYRAASGDDKIICKWMYLAGLIHDIGKLMIPLISHTDGALTEDERGAVEQHTRAGAQLLAERDYPPEMIAAAGQHHERMDGSGYPHGITSDKIHPTAQVIMIADVFDALISPRAYKPAMSKTDAIELMQGERDKYRPAYLAALVEVVRAGRTA